MVVSPRVLPWLALSSLLAACGGSGGGGSGDDDGAGVDGGGGGSGGGGGGGGGSECDTAGVDKVYVVTTDYRLLKFDPDLLPASGSADAAFSQIGDLNCAAGNSLAGWDPDQQPAVPMSMSVDRDGNAWVLYTSGEMFLVSIQDASCAAAGMTPLQAGFDLYGMGFVSTSAGSDDETLYIAGGQFSEGGVVPPASLGSVDKATKTVTPIADLPSAMTNPELTGTGAAELWAYFPGGLVDEAYVGQVDKASATIGTQYPLDALPGVPRAWAFAQYGGRFYVFITYEDFFGDQIAGVKVVDPATPGQITTFDTGNVIVGAGVSTCAPTEPVE